MDWQIRCDPLVAQINAEFSSRFISEKKHMNQLFLAKTTVMWPS